MATETSKSPPTLEDAYLPKLLEATPQNQTLVLRNYCRWKIIDAVFSVGYGDEGVRQFVDTRHNSQGRGIRDIACDLNEIMRSFILGESDSNLMTGIVQKAGYAAQDLFEAAFPAIADSHKAIEYVLRQSPKNNSNFDLYSFLSNISKKALDTLVEDLEIPHRGFAEKGHGAGYRRKKAVALSLSVKERWSDKAGRKKILEAFAKAWDNPKRRVGASFCAAAQMQADPGKQARMSAARRKEA